MFGELVKTLMKTLKVSEEDAIVAAICAFGGFTLDALLFPAGMPPGMVTTLSGLGGLLGSKWLRGRTFVLRLLLRQVDKIAEAGHMTKDEAAAYKRKLIDSWFTSRRPRDLNEGVV